MMRMRTVVALLFVTTAVLAQPAVPPIELFLAAGGLGDRQSRAALDEIAPVWRDDYAAMIVDVARLLRPAAAAIEDTATAEFAGGGEPGDESGSRNGRSDDLGGPVRRRPSQEGLTRTRLIQFLERRTGKRFDPQLREWRRWVWSRPYQPHPDYARFKGELYSRIDRRMARFFQPGAKALIRLDEVDWGGVTVNGIPPLYYPKVLPAAEARYLRDNHVVFGLVVNGEARAYPKRILAWHEMARDRVGGVELHVVYCTLCGTVIPYESVAAGRTWRLGTSGLLYRSNKLMFDEETGSLWSTLEGKPVIGELVDRGIELQARPVVTTTWGEWKSLHPNTTVLSLDTGHERDYGEGAAYRDYFSHDNLYFQVPDDDRRLKNKAEVLTFKVRAPDGVAVPVAIAQSRLARQPVYPFEAAGRRFLIVTSRRGANRVYALGSSDVAFQTATAPGDVVRDGNGREWRVTEDALVGPDGTTLPRTSAQRAFWFGWRAQYPETLLVQ
jgi:Protein of unknown function (DUF3179)